MASAPAEGAQGTVVPRHIFGLKGDVRNNVHYTDETVVVFPCGATTVVHNTDTREQRFIPSANSPNFVSEGISALAVTPNKRFVAVAECAERPAINLYDLNNGAKRRSKALSSSEVGSRSFVCVTFSSDSKYCLAQGGAPDWTLVSWQWDKAKAVATGRVSSSSSAAISQTSYSPADSSIVCVSGNGVFKFMRATDGMFKPLQMTVKRDPQHYLCHAWLRDDRCIAGTDAGDLLLFDNLEFKQPIFTPDDTGAVGAIVQHGDGFVAGCAGGVVFLFEMSDDSREQYKITKRFAIADNLCRITSLAVSPSEDCLACTLENHQMFVLNLSNSDIMKEDAMNFEPLTTSVHAPGDNGAPHITGLDTCVRKPLVATCGLDKCVRIWNYETREVELCEAFEEEALSIAFDPFGLHIVVGFTDRLRLMSLLMDSIRMTREFNIKVCREVRYSNGGGCFAAVNNNTVQVYNAYSGENTKILRGHNGKVRALAWSTNDKFVYGAGSDGVLIQWEVAGGTKVSSFEIARVSFACVAPHLSGGFKQLPRAFAAGSDFILRQITLGTRMEEAKESDEVEDCEIESPEPLGQIVISPTGNMLFVSTAPAEQLSSIHVYELPLTSESRPVELACHAAPITRMRLSHDGSLLFAASEDGSMSVYDVQERLSAKQAKGREREQPLAFAEEILVTRADLDDKETDMMALTDKVNELQKHNEYQLRLKDMNYNQRIAEVSAKFQAEIDQDTARYTDLMQENREMEMNAQAALDAQAVSHGQRMQDLQGTYDAKIAAEQKRFAELVEEREALNAQWNDKNQQVMEANQQELGRLTASYDQQVQQEIDARLEIDKLIDSTGAEAHESVALLEEDAEFEVKEVKRTNEARLSAEREGMLRLKGEHALMRTEFNSLLEKIEEGKQSVKKREGQKNEKIEQIKGLEKDIQGHKKEIREREETIQDKDKRIYDLKKKNQELEKFKFVLDYKIKELKRQIEPREKEIADMRQQIEDMDHELEQYHKSNAALDLMIGELRLKMDGMQREIDDQRETLGAGAGTLQRFRTDLRECVQHVADNKALKTALTALYKKHVQNFTHNISAEGGGDGDLQRECNRQREYLEKSVESLKRKLAKDTKLHGVENARLMRENVSLLREINDLRRDKKYVDSEKAERIAAAARGRGADKREEAWREIDMQQQTIMQLAARLRALQQELGLPLDDDIDMEGGAGQGPESGMGEADAGAAGVEEMGQVVSG